MDLKDFRSQIDTIDNELMRLFDQRMDVVSKIAEYKEEHGLPVFDPHREQEKLSQINNPHARKLYSALFEISRERQTKARTDLQNKTHILVINGPNLNMLGVREPNIYGNKSYSDLVAFVEQTCDELSVVCECFQSNHEGEIIDVIQAAYGKFNGIVINPAAFTHTSIAIYDALKAVGIRAVEVHLSNITEREEYRKTSYVSAACERTIAGHGFEGYAQAIRWLATERKS